MPSFWILKVGGWVRSTKNIVLNGVFYFWINDDLCCLWNIFFSSSSFDSLPDRLLYNMFNEHDIVCCKYSWQLWINIHHPKKRQWLILFPSSLKDPINLIHCPMIAANSIWCNVWLVFLFILSKIRFFYILRWSTSFKNRSMKSQITG